MIFISKKNVQLIILMSAILIPKNGYSQYLIEGQIDTNSIFKMAHLDILDTWDAFSSISDKKVVKSVQINPDGTFRFTGNELSEKEGYYRIRYSKNENRLSINSLDRNFINFIFSNRDTIRIVNNTYESGMAQNRIMLEYIEKNDSFTIKQSSSINNLNANMQSVKHKEYCVNEISNHKYGLPNMFFLYSSGITINENPILYKKVYNDLLKSSCRPQYSESLGTIIQVHDYKSLEQRNNWLKAMVIISIIANVILLLFFFMRKKSSSAKSVENVMINLTNKEIEVLQLIKDKKTNKEIALELFVSEATIKTHINNIYRKMNVKSRQEAINYL